MGAMTALINYPFYPFEYLNAFVVNEFNLLAVGLCYYSSRFKNSYITHTYKDIHTSRHRMM